MSQTERSDPRTDADEDLGLPPQADPQLRLSRGRATRLQITLVTIACIALIVLMLYGLNRPASESATPSASRQSTQPQTTGAARQQ